MKLRPVSMDFNYGSSFGERSPSAYETLLLDAMIGRCDALHAAGHGGGELARGAADSGCLENQKFEFPNYAAGTWGPEAADEMLARRGHAWRTP